jgi:hypothetical protein
MARAREGYNGVAATYFAGMQQENNVLKLGYVIAQANGKARVRRLEVLIEFLTLHQGNMFAHGSLVFLC